MPLHSRGQALQDMAGFGHLIGKVKERWIIIGYSMGNIGSYSNIGPTTGSNNSMVTKCCIKHRRDDHS